MEKAPQLLVTSGIVRGIHRLVVLTEELLMLSFGEVSQDHQRIGWVFRRLCSHATQPTLACRTQPARRTSQEAGTVGPDQGPLTESTSSLR